MQMLLRREKMSPLRPDVHKHKRSCGWVPTISITKERINIGDSDNGYEITRHETEVHAVLITRKLFRPICFVRDSNSFSE